MNLKNPGIIGLGISDKKTFKSACDMADGAIIGSAFVKMLTETGGGFENIKKICLMTSFKNGGSRVFSKIYRIACMLLSYSFYVLALLLRQDYFMILIRGA